MELIREMFASAGSFPVSTTACALSFATIAYEIQQTTLKKVAFAAGCLLGIAIWYGVNEKVKKDPDALQLKPLGTFYIGSEIEICQYNALSYMESLVMAFIPFGLTHADKMSLHLSKTSLFAKTYFQNSFALGVRAGVITTALVYQICFTKDHYFPKNRDGSFGISTS